MNMNDNINGYREKVLKVYGELNGSLHLVEIQRDVAAWHALGLSLAGNRDLATMSVYVVGIQPASLAAASGLIRIGDELLEINGHVLYGRSHLNSSAIIRSVTSKTIRLLLLRSEDYQARMAVSPLKLPRVEYKDDTHTLIPKKPTSRSSEDCRTGDDVDNRLDLVDAGAEDSHTEEVVEDKSFLLQPPSSTLNPAAPAETRLNNIHTSPQIVISRPSDASHHDTTMLVNDASSSTKQHLPITDRVHAAEVTVHRPNDSDASDSRHANSSVRGHETSDPSGGVSSTTPIAAQCVERFTSSAGANQRVQTADTHLCKNTSSEDERRRRSSDNGAISGATAAGPSRVQLGLLPDSAPDLLMTSVGTEDPLTCPVATGRQTLVEIRKGKTALGVKVLGGSDTSIKSIIIHEIYSGGAVANDGRLRPGDQITEVNGVDVRECTHNRALQLLRQTTSPTMRLVVCRRETGGRDEELCETTSVELIKRPGKGLGISIVERGICDGIIIADIVKGGTAETDGRLFAGDQILTVNGEDFREVTQQYAAELLKTLMGKVSLSIGRLKGGLRPAGGVSGSRSNSCYGDLGMLKSESNGSDCRTSVAATTQQRVTKRNTIGYRHFGMCLKTMSDHDDSSP